LNFRIDELRECHEMLEERQAELVDRRIDELRECHEMLEEKQAELAERHKSLGEREAKVEDSLRAIHNTLLKHDSILRTESLIGLPQEVLDSQAANGRNDQFFKHLEFQYRGTFEQIVRSLECYSSILDTISAGSVAVDLGCGRGEWLSILSAHGIRGIGVDLNENKVAQAKDQGFEAECADAVTFLKSLNEEVSVITLFHVVEHLPLNYLLAVIDLAFSKLSEDGILIMEMPNVRNFKVASFGFFMDPSHRKPLPPHLLSFMAQNSGFNDVDLVFLKSEESDDDQRLMFGEQEGVTSCPDVAVLARKKEIGSKL
jgi:O-antigen chain-terminating methyltransferase